MKAIMKPFGAKIRSGGKSAVITIPADFVANKTVKIGDKVKVELLPDTESEAE